MHARASERVVVIGAGIGGLTAAALLAARGFAVTVVEAAATPGGKLREQIVDGRAIDAGPTVFTMRWVFEEIFAALGASLADHLSLTRAEVLARHSWPGGDRLDLFADPDCSAEAIAAFAGPAEAKGFRAFSAEAARIYRTLERPFLDSAKPSPFGLTMRLGLARLPELMAIRPYTKLWSALGSHFRDPRLTQLFGRYATYCGSSPFAAPATLMLIADVERQGVWLVEGGMHRIARALETLGKAHGASFRYNARCSEIRVVADRARGVRLASGEEIDADHVICNADPAALAAGCFGRDAAGALRAPPPAARSLSAITWSCVATTSGFPLARHSIFFSHDYRAEFAALIAGRLPGDPTIYVCAQDRDDRGGRVADGPERLLVIVNAPPSGDSAPLTAAEIDACTTRTFAALAAHGLSIQRQATEVTTPSGFESLFPATGGALYGRASHGWAASFLRPCSRTRIPGLWLAGGATHPGAGVPMAALSGRLAAEALIRDRASIRRFHPAAMVGGMSTR